MRKKKAWQLYALFKILFRKYWEKKKNVTNKICVVFTTQYLNIPLSKYLKNKKLIKNISNTYLYDSFYPIIYFVLKNFVRGINKIKDNQTLMGKRGWAD